MKTNDLQFLSMTFYAAFSGYQEIATNLKQKEQLFRYTKNGEPVCLTDSCSGDGDCRIKKGELSCRCYDGFAGERC